MSDNNNLLEAALEYAKQGDSVFPIKPRNKKPPLTQHGFKDASQLQVTIREWWKRWPNANIGLRCNGKLVADFDGKAGEASKAQLEAKYGNLPRTWIIRTGGGTEAEPKEQGLQYVYRVPTDLNIRPGAGKYGYQNFDIRANDSYIVAVPSITRLPYETIDDSPIANAPEWLINIAKASKNGNKPVVKRKQGEAILEGQRDATLISMAGAMRRQGADQAAIEAALLEINTRQCKPPLPEHQVLEKAKSAARYEPRPNTDQVPHFNLTDYGNAERLAKQYGDIIRYSPERKMWLIWNDKVWEWDLGGVRIAKLAKKAARNICHEAADENDDDQYKELIKHAIATERQVKLDAMIESLKSEPGIAVMLAELDTNHWLLNVNNGTIDLKTGELKPHDPANMITELLPTDYNPAATSSKWTTFLDRIFNGNADLIAYIQRAMGYSITGNQSEQVFFFCYGSGFNGKSTLLNTCRLVMGNYATQVPPTAFMVDKTKRGGPDEAISSLKNKRLVCSTELEDGQRLSVSLVKRMTGGEPLWCEHKFERGYNFQPTHKLWLSGNHEPTITDTTNSIWYRLKKIPFVVEILEGEREKGYAEKLAVAHSAAILTWLVRGCAEWVKIGDLVEPEAVKQAVAEYRDQQDILHDFLAECCLFKKSESVDQAELYKAYKTWCETNDAYVISKPNFTHRIREKGAMTGRRHGNKATWQGIRVLTDDERVNGVNQVNDFSQSSLREASTGKTLHKTDNLVNPINPFPDDIGCKNPGCDGDEPIIDEKTGAYKCSKCGRYYLQPKGEE